MPRRHVVLYAIGFLGLVGVAFGFWAQTGSPVWFLLPPVAVAVNVVLILLARRRLADPSRWAALTGRVVGTQQAGPTLGHGAANSWVGGANVPGALGRLNATWPLAVLTITGRILRLRIRPRWLASWMGGADVAVTAEQQAVVFPAATIWARAPSGSTP